MGDTLNVFLFLNLLPYVRSKADILTRYWETDLGYNTFASFADTGYLLGRQKHFPVTSRDAASKQLEMLMVLYTLFLGDASCHLTTQ